MPAAVSSALSGCAASVDSWVVPTFNRALSWGWIGVDLFFVLSGFLITYLLLTEKQQTGTISLKNFFARRALRIWPVYYTGLAVFCFILPILYNNVPVPIFRKFFIDHLIPMVFFLGNYTLTFRADTLVAMAIFSVPLLQFVAPLWSIAIEEQFYIGWSIVLKNLRNRGLVIKSILALLAVSVGLRTILIFAGPHLFKVQWPHTIYYHSTLSHMDGLMIGALIAAFMAFDSPVLGHFGKRAFSCVAAGMAIVAAIVAWAPDVKDNHPFNAVLFLALAVAFGLTLIGTIFSSFWSRLFANPILREPGKLTYAMYVFHFAVIVLVGLVLTAFQVNEPLTRWYALVGGSLAGVYAIALGSWFMVERTALRQKKRFERVHGGAKSERPL